MLELNPDGAAAPAPIKEGSDASFAKDVLETSRQAPVIVDFWAPWCGPCKTLGPMLEDAVTKAKGAVKMVKIDIERHQAIAGQLGIQSIPTVYAFWQGQPVDGFQGAVGAREIQDFVDRVAALAGGGGDEGIEEYGEAAERMLEEGDAVGAAQIFAAMLADDPENAAAYAGLIRANIALGELRQARGILDSIPGEIASAPEIETARARLDIAERAASAGPVDDLRRSVDANPDDHKARFDLSLSLHASGDVGGAVDQLLELHRRDGDWNDGAAKSQLFKIFDTLKPQDPIALAGRRRLSSMIFA